MESLNKHEMEIPTVYTQQQYYHVGWYSRHGTCTNILEEVITHTLHAYVKNLGFQPRPTAVSVYPVLAKPI